MDIAAIGLEIRSNGLREGVRRLRDLEQQGGKTERTVKGMGDAVDRTDRNMQTMSRTTDRLKTAVGALAGVMSVREVIRYSDAWNNAANQLRQVTNSTSELEQTQQALVNVSRDTRSNFESTANLYARLARSTTELGLTQQDLLGLTTTINQSFAASGATAEEASAAITQLSQGLAAGALRGDEFNSVSEQAPGIMRAIAESLDLTIGELREFAATGGITADIVVTALQGASDTIANDFGKTIATFGQDMEVARTNLVEWVGTSEEVQSVTAALGDTMIYLSENIDEIVKVAQAAAILYAGRFVGSQIAAQTAMRGTITVAASLRTAMLALGGPIGLLIGVGGLLYTFREELGFTEKQAGLTEQQIADLRAEMQGMSEDDLSGSLDSLNEALDQATLKAATAREQLANLRAEQDQGQGPRAAFRELEAGGYEAEINGIRAVAEAEEKLLEIEQRRNVANVETIRRWTESQRAQEEAGESTDQYAGEVDKLRLKLDSTYAAQQKYNEAVALLDNALAEGSISQADYNDLKGKAQQFLDSASGATKSNTDALREQAAATEEAARAAEQYANELESLRRSLDPVYARQQDLAAATATLDRGLITGAITLSEYLELWDAAADTFIEAGKESDDLKDKTKENTDEMTREIDRFYNSFDDALVDMVKGADDSFDSVKDAFDTMLAELIVAAGKNEIRLRLGMETSGAMQGGFGQLFGTGRGDGLGSVLNAGKSLLGIGASNAAGYTGALGAATSTGYGGALGSAVSGAASASSGFMGAASAAAPWLAGGLAVDNILGLGIVDGIVSGISGLFGSSPTPFSGRFGTRESTTPGTFEHQDSTSERFYQESAFGSVGFLDDGTERLQRAGTGSKSWAEELAVATAQRDNLTASLAQTTLELEAMRNTVQGLETSSKTAADIVDFALNTRPRAAIDAMTGDFGEFVQSLEGGIEQIVSEAQTAQQALSVMQSSMGRLNLQFDAAGAAAYEAAGFMALHAGGVEQLAAVQDAYYQAAFSDAERLQHQHEDVRTALNRLTDANVTSVEQLRQLVEAQEQNSEAGASLALDLMSLAPALRESSSAVRDAIEAQYQSSLGRKADADGLAYWFNQVTNGGLTLEQALWHISISSEAAQRGLENVAEAAEDFSALEAALDGLQDSVKSETSLLEEQYRKRREAAVTAYQDEQEALRERIENVGESVSGLSQIVNMLDRAVKDTQLDTEGLQRSRRAQAQGFLASQLAAGRITDPQALENALSIVSEPSEALFSTFEDYARDQLTTQGLISKLGGNAEDALTVEERMLQALENETEQLADQHQLELSAMEAQHQSEIARLDGILERAKDQVDGIKGVDNSVKALADALRAFNDASTGAGGGTVSSGSGGVGGAVEDALSGTTGVENTIRAAYAKILQQSVSQADIDYWSGTGLSGDALAKTIASTGAGEGNRHALSWWQEFGGMADVPGFANGGSHDGGWRMVGERGPELEWTPPSRIMSNSSMGNNLNTDAVRQSVDAMSNRLDGVLRGILNASTETASIIDDWDTLGQPGVRNVTA